MNNNKLQNDIKIIEYDPRHKDIFRDINYSWLKKYFEIEPYDRIVLTNPQQHIIDQSGFIFFAQVGDEIVGTCALLKHTDLKYELAKFGVIENYQRCGIGQLLTQRTIDKALELKAEKLILVTSKVLKEANKLYNRFGFVEVDLSVAGPLPYKRESIAMELDLSTQ